MFGRIWRIIKSKIGWLIGLAEDPAEILEQNIRDMQAKLPEINNAMAKAKGGLIKLENESKEYEGRMKSLTSKIKAALSNNMREQAASMAVQLKREQDGLARTSSQIELAKKSYDELVKTRDGYMMNLKRRQDELKAALRENRTAKIKGEIAEAFESFEVGDFSQTHEEMIDKLKDQSAEAEAKLAVASDSMTMKEIKMEQQSEELEGMELLKQFEMEMGLTGSGTESPPDLGEKSRGKTIGVNISDGA